MISKIKNKIMNLSFVVETKSKCISLAILIVITLLVFFILCFIIGIFCYLFYPDQYMTISQPKLQSLRTDSNRLLAIYQNPKMKNAFCSNENFAYTGVNLSYEQFCHFTYQKLPDLNSEVDISYIGLNYQEVNFVNVCLLKTSQSSKDQNQFQKMEKSAQVNKYVCQKYRTTSHLQLVNSIHIDHIYGLEIQLEIVPRDMQIRVQAQLIFQQQKNWLIKKWVDWYFIISIGFTLGISILLAIVIFVIGLGKILNLFSEQNVLKYESIHRQVKKKQ